MNTFYKYLNVLFLLLIFISCTKKEKTTFSIYGSISPVESAYLILKQEVDIERKVSKIIDTIKIDDKGKFKASFNTEPYLYSLILPNKKKITLAINKGQNININISNYISHNFKTKIKGSKDTDELLAYEVFRAASLDRLVKSVRREIEELKKAENPDQEKITMLGKLELDNYDKHLDELVDFIKKNMTSTMGLYATSIRWKGAHNFSTFDSITTTFETKYPTENITNKLRQKVNRLRQTAVGGKAKDIHMHTSDGVEVKLSSIKSKYTLIDFWASWCGPCRRESPILNLLTNTYSKKDFDIYGVSLDNKKERWIDALKKDNRNWTNVSSLEKFKTPAAYDYAVTALPDNYLIDNEGKIIAKNIHGEELKSLIIELLDK